METGIRPVSECQVCHPDDLLNIFENLGLPIVDLRALTALFGPIRRDRKEEFGSLPNLRFNPDAAAAVLHDSLANSETDPGAGVTAFGMQTLEDAKDPLMIFRVDSDSVIFNGK